MPGSSSLTLLVLLAGSGLQSEANQHVCTGSLRPRTDGSRAPPGAGERGWGGGCAGGRGSPSLLFYAEGAGAAGAAAHS